MKFELDVADFTIIMNALNLYKDLEKQAEFGDVNEVRIKVLQDKLTKQLLPERF